ncbi:hypothetical protein CEXT_101921 [Caerostris extrusa]|uniref:Uncharacterized protein n=1 Tax=Caerostris extrusa TaxID=172846 RepID=A0AAV4Y7J5_CAEEX|nr:hypothetical protein CEXT_101921 [Caerostris extrusa]
MIRQNCSLVQKKCNRNPYFEMKTRYERLNTGTNSFMSHPPESTTPQNYTERRRSFFRKTTQTMQKYFIPRWKFELESNTKHDIALRVARNLKHEILQQTKRRRDGKKWEMHTFFFFCHTKSRKPTTPYRDLHNPYPLCFWRQPFSRGIDTPPHSTVRGLNERSGDEPVVPQPAETVLSVYRSRLVWVRGERWKRSSNSALPSSGNGFGMQMLVVKISFNYRKYKKDFGKCIRFLQRVRRFKQWKWLQDSNIRFTIPRTSFSWEYGILEILRMLGATKKKGSSDRGSYAIRDLLIEQTT